MAKGHLRMELIMEHMSHENQDRTEDRVFHVSRIQRLSRVLGPGARSVVWFHGCSRNCPGCVAAEMNASSDFFSCTDDELLNEVLSIQGTEGVTMSGGEPFDQNVVAMLHLLSGVKNHGLSVMVYTGYKLADIKNDPVKCKCLDYIDILVDGPYVESLDGGELWRGSANQTIHFLTPRYEECCKTVSQHKGRPLEVSIGGGNGFTFAGIPPKGFRPILERELEQRGLVVHW